MRIFQFADHVSLKLASFERLNLLLPLFRAQTRCGRFDRWQHYASAVVPNQALVPEIIQFLLQITDLI
jgi:hypothetical protein